MFTGIIESVQSIQTVTPHGGGVIITINLPEQWQLKQGESVSIDGICSTVTTVTPTTFTVEYMPETIRRTTARQYKTGSRVNLERSMMLNDRISGHWVTGHVDTIGTIDQITTDGNSHTFVIQHDKANTKYLIDKGSVTINGISITVIQPTEYTFSVAIIPQTWQHTTMQFLKDGDEVNIEYDQLAKYVERMTHYGS